MSDTGPTRGAVIPQEMPMAAASWPVAATEVSNASARTTRSGPIIMKTVRTRNRAAESKATSPCGDVPPTTRPPSGSCDHAILHRYPAFPSHCQLSQRKRINPHLRLTQPAECGDLAGSVPCGDSRFAATSGDILFDDRADAAGQCAVLGQKLRRRVAADLRPLKAHGSFDPSCAGCT